MSAKNPSNFTFCLQLWDNVEILSMLIKNMTTSFHSSRFYYIAGGKQWVEGLRKKEKGSRTQTTVWRLLGEEGIKGLSGKKKYKKD